MTRTRVNCTFGDLTTTEEELVFTPWRQPACGNSQVHCVIAPHCNMCNTWLFDIGNHCSSTFPVLMRADAWAQELASYRMPIDQLAESNNYLLPRVYALYHFLLALWCLEFGHWDLVRSVGFKLFPPSYPYCHIQCQPLKVGTLHCVCYEHVRDGSCLILLPYNSITSLFEKANWI